MYTLVFVMFVYSGNIVQPFEASREGSHPDVPHEVSEVSEACWLHRSLYGANGELASLRDKHKPCNKGAMCKIGP